MRLKSLASTFRASTRKFYEIVQEKQDRIMPLTPEQAIISKYLNQKPPLPTPHRRSITPDPNGPSKAVNYQDIIARSPHGSIVEREYKDAKLNLISLNFQKIELREVYKICEKYSPDIILLQTRPENYLPRFKLIAKQKNVFSDKLYFEQLLLAPNKISKLMDPAVSSRLNKIILNEQQTKQAGQGQQAEKIFVKDHKGIMEDSVILMAGQYASANKCSILLSDLPEQPWREWICNSHSLMQLQETFKHITKNIPFYQSLKLTPEQLGCLLKPHLFLSLRDRYIATLIEMVVGSGRHKKVMSLTGVMQNEAIMHILDHQLLLRTNEAAQLEFTPIVQYLVGPPVKSSIIRNVTGWQIIEKHIILDVLHHGADIMHVPLEELALTNKIISYYGVGFNSYDENSLMRFRYDKSLEYLRLMQSQIREGSQLKRKFMLREAIRANSQQDDD